MAQGIRSTIVVVAALGIAVSFTLLVLLSSVLRPRAVVVRPATTVPGAELYVHYAELWRQLGDKLMPYTERTLMPADAAVLKALADEAMQWQVPADERASHLELVVAMRGLAAAAAREVGGVPTASAPTSALQARVRQLMNLSASDSSVPSPL